MFDVYQLLCPKTKYRKCGMCVFLNGCFGGISHQIIKVLFERIITSSKRDGATFYIWGWIIISLNFTPTFNFLKLWEKFPDSTTFCLELRVKNSIKICTMMRNILEKMPPVQLGLMEDDSSEMTRWNGRNRAAVCCPFDTSWNFSNQRHNIVELTIFLKN